MTCKNNRYNLLDAFKGIAVIWIVIFHILGGYRVQYCSILNLIIKNGALGVQIFFVVSGYGISSALKKTVDSYRSAVNFLIRRIKKIYFIYWIHLIFAAIIFPVVTAFVSMLKSHSLCFNFFNYSLSEWIQIVTLTKVFASTNWKLNLAFCPLNGVVWFIAIIFQIYIISFLSLFFGRRYNLILFLVFLLSLSTLVPSIKSLLPYGIFLPYFSHFYVGVILFNLIQNNYILKKLRSILLALIFCSILSFVIIYIIFTPFIFSILIGLLFWIIYPIKDKLIKFRVVKILILIGSFSYSLYLLHVPLWPLVEMFIRNLIPISQTISTPLIAVPTVIILSYIWYLFFEKQKNLKDFYTAIKKPLFTILRSREDLQFIIK